jgi:hypothetical protein
VHTLALDQKAGRCDPQSGHLFASGCHRAGHRDALGGLAAWYDPSIAQQLLARPDLSPLLTKIAVKFVRRRADADGSA